MCFLGLLKFEGPFILLYLFFFYLDFSYIYFNMNDELEKRLKEINTEDIILGVFIVVIFLSYIANQIEKSYFINRDDRDRLGYYYIQIFVFLIVIVVNIYYVWLSYKEVENLSFYDSYNRKKYAYLDLWAGLFALMATSIILYVAITDREIEAEISL